MGLRPGEVDGHAAPGRPGDGGQGVGQGGVVGRPHQPAAVGRPEHLDAERRPERIDEGRRRRTRHLGQRRHRREPQQLAAVALGRGDPGGIGVQGGLHHLVPGHEGLQHQPAAAVLPPTQPGRPGTSSPSACSAAR